MLFVEPIQLFVDILLREDEHLEFFGLNEVRALGDLLDKHAQQIAAFFQKLIAITAKALLLGKCRQIQTGEPLHKAVAQG